MFIYISPGLKTNNLFADTCNSSGLQNLAHKGITLTVNSSKQCIIESKQKWIVLKQYPSLQYPSLVSIEFTDDLHKPFI